MIIYSVSYLTLCTSSSSPLPQVRRSHFGGGEHPGGPCRYPPPTAHPAGSLQGRGPADGRQLRRAGGALLPHQPHAALRRQPGGCAVRLRRGRRAQGAGTAQRGAADLPRHGGRAPVPRPQAALSPTAEELCL